MKETLRHKEAFEYYYMLGKERSYQKVGDEFGTSKTTVFNWSTKFNWTERVEQRDIELSKQLEEKTNTTVINEKARYRTIVKAGISEFAKKLRSGEVEIDSVLDLERLVKLDLLLMGEATERNEGGVVQNEYNITQQIEKDPESYELFRQLHRRRLHADGEPSREE